MFGGCVIVGRGVGEGRRVDRNLLQARRERHVVHRTMGQHPLGP